RPTLFPYTTLFRSQRLPREPLRVDPLAAHRIQQIEGRQRAAELEHRRRNQCHQVPPLPRLRRLEPQGQAQGLLRALRIVQVSVGGPAREEDRKSTRLNSS